MRPKRRHTIEVARYYQRLENIERRRKEAIEEKLSKRGFLHSLARLVGKNEKRK